MDSAIILFCRRKETNRFNLTLKIERNEKSKIEFIGKQQPFEKRIE